MSYKRRKEITALLSLLSVLMTITVALFANIFSNGPFTNSFISVTSIAALVAAMAATMSIMISRRLAMEREKRTIFIIYAREDLEAAREIASALKKHGFNPWLDVDEITPGQIWQKAVINALERSALAIVLVSKNLDKKGFVQQELKTALEMLPQREEDISPVIPVVLDNSKVPEQLSHIQWVDLSKEDGFDRLLKGIKRIFRERENDRLTSRST